MYSFILAAFLSTAATHGECPREVEQSFNLIERDIQELKNDVKYIDRRVQKKHMRMQIKSLKRNLRRMKQLLCRRGKGSFDSHPIVQQPIVNAPVQSHHPRAYLIPQQQLRDIIRHSRSVMNSEEKMFYISQASENYCLNTNQVKSLLDTLTWDRDKIAALELLLPVIIDSNNSYKLAKKLTFSDSKRKFRTLINRVNPVQQCQPIYSYR